MTPDEVIASLPSWSRGDLLKLRGMLTLMLDSVVVENRATSESEALYRSMRERYPAWPPYHVFKRSRNYPRYRDTVVGALAWIEQGFKPKTRAYRLKAMALTVLCLDHYLGGRGMLTLLRNLDKVTEAVDSCFPGYADGGLLPLLLDKGIRLRAHPEQV